MPAAAQAVVSAGLAFGNPAPTCQVHGLAFATWPANSSPKGEILLCF